MQQNSGTHFKFNINGGNNHMLVKQVLKQRQQWAGSDKERFDECNFIWTQWAKERHFQSLESFVDKKQAIDQEEQENAQDA